MVRRYLAALSFANLLYLPVWARLIAITRAAEFRMRDTPLRSEYAAAVCGVVLLAAVLLGANAMFERAPNPVRSLEIPLGILLLAVSLQNLATGDTRLALLHFGGTHFMACMAVALVSLVLVGIFHRLVRPAVVWGLVTLSPFCAIAFGMSAYRAATRMGLPTPPLAPRLSSSSQTRVVWIIFDEWDQRLSFDGRSQSLQLPALDRLKSESFSASNALPPESQTLLSMPSLITGRVTHRVTEIDSQNMILNFDGGGKQRFGDAPNLFSEARRMGLNSAVFGWYLPYCRVLAPYISDCWWQDFSAPSFVASATFGEALVKQPRSLLETLFYSPFGQSLTLQKHTRTYLDTLEHAKCAVTDGGIQLALLHFNVPHPPYVYERATHGFTRSNTETGYEAALALVNRTVADLRETMERAGTWNSVILLFSADHFFRVSPLVNGVRDRRVPYLIHFPGQSQGVSYSSSFNTIVTRDLILAMFRSEVSDSEGVVRWLDQHRQ